MKYSKRGRTDGGCGNIVYGEVRYLLLWCWDGGFKGKRIVMGLLTSGKICLMDKRRNIG